MCVHIDPLCQSMFGEHDHVDCLIRRSFNHNMHDHEDNSVAYKWYMSWYKIFLQLIIDLLPFQNPCNSQLEYKIQHYS
jgi:hypothetical protein